MSKEVLYEKYLCGRNCSKVWISYYYCMKTNGDTIYVEIIDDFRNGLLLLQVTLGLCCACDCQID